jgi:hypothetical protein
MSFDVSSVLSGLCPFVSSETIRPPVTPHDAVAQQQAAPSSGGLAADAGLGLWDSLFMSDEEKQLRAKQKEAAALLRGKFEIGDADAAGMDPLRKLGVADNMVSQEEFDAISKTYAQVMLGQGHLKMDASGLEGDAAAAYQAKMLEDIAAIMQTKSGRAMVSELVAGPNDHDTVLKPRFKDGDPAKGLDTQNGEADGKDLHGSVLKGKGSDSEIQMNPGNDVVVPEAKDKWLPMRSDVLLYHEMVHALDQTKGTLDLTTVVGGQDHGVEEAEHVAVGIGDHADRWMSENNYRASRAEIAANSFAGVREGDDDMAQRDSYLYHKR